MIVNNNKDFLRFKRKFDIFETNPNRQKILHYASITFSKKKKRYNIKKNMKNALKKN